MYTSSLFQHCLLGVLPLSVIYGRADAEHGTDYTHPHSVCLVSNGVDLCNAGGQMAFSDQPCTEWLTMLARRGTAQHFSLTQTSIPRSSAYLSVAEMSLQSTPQLQLGSMCWTCTLRLIPVTRVTLVLLCEWLKDDDSQQLY